MSVEKKFSLTYKIYSPLDLSKEWFIYWNERGKRRKKKGGINRFHTFDERMAAAKELVESMERDYVLPSPVIDQMNE